MKIFNLYFKVQHYYSKLLKGLPLFSFSCTLISLVNPDIANCLSICFIKTICCPCEVSGLCDLVAPSLDLPKDAPNINYQPKATQPMNPTSLNPQVK
jgi:hypothetical protein